VGTEKQLVAVTQALRALNPNFLVLHYHLSMWQSAPATTFILPDASCTGTPVCWANDYPTVTTHEDWFWHNASAERVASSADQKLLVKRLKLDLPCQPPPRITASAGKAVHAVPQV